MPEGDQLSTKKKLNDLRVVDLRNELEKRDLDKTGVKPALIERLSKALKDEGEDPDTYSFEIEGEKPVIKSPRLSRKSGSEKCNEDGEEEETQEEEHMDTEDIKKDLEKDEDGKGEEEQQLLLDESENKENFPQQAPKNFKASPAMGGLLPTVILTDIAVTQPEILESLHSSDKPTLVSGSDNVQNDPVPSEGKENEDTKTMETDANDSKAKEVPVVEKSVDEKKSEEDCSSEAHNDSSEVKDESKKTEEDTTGKTAEANSEQDNDAVVETVDDSSKPTEATDGAAGDQSLEKDGKTEDKSEKGDAKKAVDTKSVKKDEKKSDPKTDKRKTRSAAKDSEKKIGKTDKPSEGDKSKGKGDKPKDDKRRTLGRRLERRAISMRIIGTRTCTDKSKEEKAKTEKSKEEKAKTEKSKSDKNEKVKEGDKTEKAKAEDKTEKSKDGEDAPKEEKADEKKDGDKADETKTEKDSKKKDKTPDRKKREERSRDKRSPRRRLDRIRGRRGRSPIFNRAGVRAWQFRAQRESFGRRNFGRRISPIRERIRPSHRDSSLEDARASEIARRNREEAFQLEREKERLRIEKEKLERLRSEVLRKEREQQREEREKIEREREELRRRSQLPPELDFHHGMKRSFEEIGDRDFEWERRKRLARDTVPESLTRFEDISRGRGGSIPERRSDRYEGRSERFESRGDRFEGRSKVESVREVSSRRESRTVHEDRSFSRSGRNRGSSDRKVREKGFERSSTRDDFVNNSRSFDTPHPWDNSANDRQMDKFGPTPSAGDVGGGSQWISVRKAENWIPQMNVVQPHPPQDHWAGMEPPRGPPPMNMNRQPNMGPPSQPHPMFGGPPGNGIMGSNIPGNMPGNFAANRFNAVRHF